MLGHCHELALAIHEATGLPLVAIEEPIGHRLWRVAHVAVQVPDGKLLDVCGIRSLDELLLECREAGGCDTTGWRRVAVTRGYVDACVEDGYLPGVEPGLAEAREVAAALLEALCLAGGAPGP
jgi:hypothetical protein